MFEFTAKLYFVACSQEVICEVGHRKRSEGFFTEIIIAVIRVSPSNRMLPVVGKIIVSVFWPQKDGKMAVDIRPANIDECILVQDPVDLVSCGVGVLVVPDYRDRKSVRITSSVRVNRFIDIVPMVHAHIPDVICELECQFAKAQPLLMFDIKMLQFCLTERPFPQVDIL